MNKENGQILNSSDIIEGQKVLVIKVSKDKIKLGEGMYDKKLFKQVENIIGKEIIKYSFGG
jgi:RNA polymerase-interacting CarD/CdnL/TRCF family regulator